MTMTRRRESRYIRMVKAVFKVCQRQAIPRYSSRYSRKDFTLWQHIALLVLWSRMRKSYRKYVDDFLTVADRQGGAGPRPLQAAAVHHNREVRPQGPWVAPGEGDGGLASSSS